MSLSAESCNGYKFIKHFAMLGVPDRFPCSLSWWSNMICTHYSPVSSLVRLPNSEQHHHNRWQVGPIGAGRPLHKHCLFYFSTASALRMKDCISSALVILLIRACLFIVLVIYLFIQIFAILQEMLSA